MQYLRLAATKMEGPIPDTLGNIKGVHIVFPLAAMGVFLWLTGSPRQRALSSLATGGSNRFPALMCVFVFLCFCVGFFRGFFRFFFVIQGG